MANQYSLRARDIRAAEIEKLDIPAAPTVQALPLAPDGNQLVTGAAAATPAPESMAEHVLRIAREAEAEIEKLARSVLGIPPEAVDPTPPAEEVADEPTTVQTGAVVS